MLLYFAKEFEKTEIQIYLLENFIEDIIQSKDKIVFIPFIGFIELLNLTTSI